jgi:tetratricopeptide (TPR) repeat protein
VNKNIDELLEEADKLADAGNLQRALNLYTQILSQDERHQDACMMAGAIHGELGQFPEAEQLLRRAQALNPQDMAPFLMLSNMLRAQGKNQQAIENLKNAVEETVVTDAEVFCFLGSMQSESGFVLDAIESFEIAHGLDQTDSKINEALISLRIQQADVLEKKGDHEASFELVQPLLESDDPPLDAVIVLAKLSPVFDTYDDCRYLLRRFQERGGLTENEDAVIQQALTWLDKTESSKN